MSTILLRPIAALEVDGISDPITPTEGTVGLDGTSVPYATAQIVVPFIDLDELAALDAALLAVDDVRGVLEAGDITGNTRVFDLGVRSRTVDHRAKNVTIELASDEARLIAHRALTESSYFAQQGSLRSIVEDVTGATLEPGDDATVHALTDDVSAIRNPRAKTDLTDWSSAQTLVRQAAGGPAGCPTYVAGQSAGAGVLMTYSDAFVPIQAGVTYRLSCYLTYGGTPTLLYIDALVKNAGGATLLTVPAAPVLSDGTWQRLAVEFKAPATATKATLRAYTGSFTSGQYCGVTGWRLSPVGLDPTDTGYYDGDTTDTTEYAYAYAGNTSTRTALIERDPAALIWAVGDSAWEFLEPLVASVGKKLFCDETRAWRLVDPATYELDGLIIASGWNAREGADRIDLGDPEVLCTGVVLRYEWIDQDGTRQERLDVAGTPGAVLERTITRPYPGPGIAAAMLARRAGQGRSQAVNVVSNWSATPGMEAQITLPGTSDQLGVVASVRWDLKVAFMELGTLGLVDVTPDSWLGWDPDEDWDDVDAGLDWEDA